MPFLMLLIAAIFAPMGQAESQTCDPRESASKHSDEILKSFFYPEELRESCAAKKIPIQSKSWRQEVPDQISKFIQTHFGGKGKTIPAIIQEPVEKMGIAEAFVDDQTPNPSGKDSEGLKAKRAKMVSSYSEELRNRILSSNLKERIQKAVDQKRCVYGVDLALKPQNGMTTVDEDEPFGTTQRSLALTKTKSKVLESIQEMEGPAASTPSTAATTSIVTTCGPPINLYSGLDPVPESVSYDIPKEAFFKDNESTLDSAKLSRIMGDLTRNLKSDRPGCTIRIKSIQIETSANQLPNTANFGRWDFSGLSEARAKFIDRALRSHLKTLENSGKIELAAPPTEINSNGEHGDGTSGPCPYSATPQSNGTYLIKMKSMSEKTENGTSLAESLDKAKYAKINIESEEVGKSCGIGEYKSTHPHLYAATQCFDVELKCK